jgi:hypothetical protein
MQNDDTKDYGFGEFQGVPVSEMLAGGMRGEAGWQGMGSSEGPEIPAINISDLVDMIFGPNAWKEVTYQEQIDSVKDWCGRFNCYYYSSPKESFDFANAYAEAMDEQAEAVVFEDLS